MKIPLRSFHIRVAIGLAVSALPVAGQAPSVSDARLQDLAYAREHYVQASRAFSAGARERALARIKELEARAATLSDTEFLLAIDRVAALTENAHDEVSLGDGGWRPEKRLPLRIIWFPDGMVVARAGPPVAELAGARITSIEGLTPEVLFQRLAELSGGPENYRRSTVTWAIEWQGILATLGIAQSPDKVRFGLILPDGRRLERVVEMAPAAEIPGMRPARLWSGELTDEEAQRGWRSAIAEGSEPAYLKQADEPFRLTTLPGLNAQYLQFRTNRDAGSRSIRQFAQETRAKLAAQPPHNLIVDLRFDGGGDITRTSELMRELPRLVKGQIFLLTGRYTFSAGIVAAAIVKQSGGDRVRIVGEGVADRLRWWSEGRQACLPNSHLCLWATDGLWDLIKGCADEDGCYGDRITPPVGKLEPEVSAPLTAAAWLGQRDPAMEVIQRDLHRSE